MSGPYQDLLIDTSKSFEDGNYFIVTIEKLEPGKIYPIQFKWKYKDGTSGKDWSSAYKIITPSEQVLGAPDITANGDTPGMITVSWDGKTVGGLDVQSQVKQVDIYISGSPFDGTKPALSFDKAGKKTVPAPAGIYTIVAYALSARGTISTQKTIPNIEVVDTAVVVEPPTLPSGLSVSPGPFVVSVNWSGSYASSGFEGFKSVDIHVRGSDVGSTATSGFSSTTQVATLTVTGTTNRQNIGLDNLRQALGLANNQAAYTSPMYFYYISRNDNDDLYKVGGTPTYTRINSSSVNPTQANFVDLVNGIISIENLVAGNGKFTSWLRTGGTYVNDVFQGGTRIELSAVNDFPDPTNSSYNILKGLTAYNSGNTKIFDLDLDAGTLTIEGSGKFTGDLEAGSGSSIFKSDSNGIYLGSGTWSGAASTFRVSRSGALTAASGTIGGLTLASDAISNSANTFKIGSTGQLLLGSESAGQNNLLLTPTQIVHRTGSTSTGIFTLDIATGTLSLSGYANTAALANKSKTYYQNDEPQSGMIQGDIWIDANDNYKVYTYTGNAWQLSQDSAAAQITANTAANRSQKFDLVGNVNLGIALNNSGSIYSNKTTYGSSITGWFLGYRNVGGGTLTPAIDIGGDTSYMRWTGGSLEIKGNITADSGSFTGNVYASGGTIGGFYIGANYLSSTTDGVSAPYYWSQSTGALSVENIFIRRTPGVGQLTGLAMLNGAQITMFGGDISMGGGTIYTGNSDASGVIDISYGTITAASGIRLNIDGSTGNIFTNSYVGVNTTDSAASTQSEGAYIGSSGLFVARRAGSTITTSSVYFAHRYSDSANTNPSFFRALRDGTNVGNLRYNTSTNVFETATVSDYRLKQNISDHNALSSVGIIKSIPIKQFSFKTDLQNKIVTGFIAHELQEVAPFAVSGEKDAVDQEGNPDYQEVGFSSLIPDTIAALQYALNKIESLEQRLDAIEG